jgi:methylthioribose-1-phosphate isomerase
MAAPTLEAIKYSKGSLSLLDQLKLPFHFEYLQIRTCEEAWDAIKKMNVGCPAPRQTTVAWHRDVALAVSTRLFVGRGGVVKEHLSEDRCEARPRSRLPRRSDWRWSAAENRHLGLARWTRQR